MTGYFAHHALRLTGYGYDVIPISRHDDTSQRWCSKQAKLVPVYADPGKQPAQRKGWRRGCPRENWTQYASCGVGILTARVPAVDVDVLDTGIADAIQAQADRVLGNAPVRFGQAPKRVMPFRLRGDPFPKMKVSWRGVGDPAEKPPAVEILADGQQFVALGIHPATGQPYRWERDLDLELPHGLLPGLDRATAERFVLAVAGAVKRLGATGIKLSGVQTFEQPKASAKAKPTGGGSVADDIRAYLERLGNDCDYDAWIKRGLAIKATLPGPDGQAIWKWWSSLSSKNDPDLTARKWATFEPRHVSAGSIFWGARR